MVQDRGKIGRIIKYSVFLFGLLGWIYGIAVQFTNPEWLEIQLSHLTPWLRVDIFTIFSFFISAFGFFVWRLTVKLAKN